MKRLAIMTLLVLAVALAVCTASRLILVGILDEAEDLTTEIFTAMHEGSPTAALDGLVELATLWEEKTPVLSFLCPHEHLHEVESNIIQAEICITYTDMEDFYSSIALISESLAHIRAAC